ncbi:MAG: endo-1,4-beta-xylanase, partial [Lachnospiraceae bacterium]|nr:endo-1,4-beta-xylanase [Lachnospiraceae bacterium]
MKRILSVILSLTITACLVGCTANPTSESASTDTSTEMTASPAETIADSQTSTEDTAVSESSETPGEEIVSIPYSADFYDYESMADLLSEYGIIFGTKINSNTESDYTLKNLISTHFDSVTASNEMKAYTLLDQNASKKSKDGMPCMNFSKSDCIISVASETGTKIRGHVLVWDAHMCDWFFREGYESNGDYVDADTLKKRLESYIDQTITYYETNYPGLVYCWDVVNEAVGDNAKCWDGSDARHIRTSRDSKPNKFYDIIGKDYVELSFLYARNTVDALKEKNPEVNIKLFYNDYSTFSADKRDAICALVDSINTYAKDADGSYRRLVDGVGMQGYIGSSGKQTGCMRKVDIINIEKAILKFWEHGVESQITEMAVRSY